MEISINDYIKHEIEGCKSIMEEMLNNQNLLKSVGKFGSMHKCIAKWK